MKISRRQAVGTVGTAAGAWLTRSVRGQQALTTTSGPFAGTRASLIASRIGSQTPSSGYGCTGGRSRLLATAIGTHAGGMSRARLSTNTTCSASGRSRRSAIRISFPCLQPIDGTLMH